MEQKCLMDIAEKNLIDAHIDGDSEAFVKIVRFYGPQLLGYLSKVCGSNTEAEDHFQETFRKVYEKAHTFRGKNLRSWIFTIAARIVIDDARKKKLRFVSLNQKMSTDSGNNVLADVLQSNGNCDPSDDIQKRELVEQVRSALDKLSPKQKTAVVLSYYQNMPYRQIAEIMNCSVGTVKTQMFRALKTLSRSLPDISGGVI